MSQTVATLSNRGVAQLFQHKGGRTGQVSAEHASREDYELTGVPRSAKWADVSYEPGPGEKDSRAAFEAFVATVYNVPRARLPQVLASPEVEAAWGQWQTGEMAHFPYRVTLTGPESRPAPRAPVANHMSAALAPPRRIGV
ncbi:MAG: hypothetical protein AAFU77_14100 [Myxococcota bacterium]